MSPADDRLSLRRPQFAVVVPAGGGGTRLGGVDKAGLRIAGVALLDGVLLATAAARQTVVVGEPRPTVRDVLWAREDPPGTGPLAALLAGLDRMADENISITGVFATDLTSIGATDVDRLLLALTPGHDAAVFVDAEGRRQPLAAVYRTAALLAALRDLHPVHNRPMRALLERLDVREVPDAGASADCDTPGDLAALRARAPGWPDA